MPAMAETAGSFSRAILLADALKEANIEPAVCLAKDYKSALFPGLIPRQNDFLFPVVSESTASPLLSGTALNNGHLKAVFLYRGGL